MQPSQFLVIVHSERPERLIEFYKDVVGLPPHFDVAPGAFSAGSESFVVLIVEPHTEVNGEAIQPQRVMLNFVVDDAIAEQRQLKTRGVPFVRDATEEPGVGMFATFRDPDGNYCQLIELYDSPGDAEPGSTQG
jgi:predicted enzyme related to lactoylglutathione lyase